MTVRKQKTSKGETKFYHYRFMSKGKLYQGVCKGCTTERDALKYEKDVKDKINTLAKQKNVQAIIENFRDELTGGSDILLSEAFELSLKKPSKRKPSDKQKAYKRSCWRDFYDYMTCHYPDIVKLADVKKAHAEEYIQYIRTKGRFNKQIIFKAKRKTATYENKIKKLSNKSCNTLHQAITEVFSKLFDDAGLIENPFIKIDKLDNESECREAFTENEIKLIAEKADDFIYPIFAIGIKTALREGDICTLKWNEVDLIKNQITRRMLKTRRTVEIPILPDFRQYLLSLQLQSGESEYVLPEHAEMYLNNRTGVTYRVKNFLESIGIETTKKVPGRSRAISIKDVHSLRHSFCYYAGMQRIPIAIVQNIVGHMTEGMTQRYQAHVNDRDKRESLLQMPDLMGLNGSNKIELTDTAQLEIEYNPERQKLIKLIDELPNDKISKVINYIERGM
jgi:integrase